jgi:hypothetical protein
VADAQILGNAVFRVLVVAADQIELVVAAAVEPARQHGIGQPGAPAALDAHAALNLRHADQHAADRQRKEHAGEEVNGRGIALLDAVEDRRFQTLMPYCRATLPTIRIKSPIENGQARRSPLRLQKPARADPEPRQQIILARLLGFLRASFRIGFDHLRRRRLE